MTLPMCEKHKIAMAKRKNKNPDIPSGYYWVCPLCVKDLPIEHK